MFNRNDYQYDYIPAQDYKVNCHRWRLAIHIEVLIFAILFSKYQVKTLNRLLFTNR